MQKTRALEINVFYLHVTGVNDNLWSDVSRLSTDLKLRLNTDSELNYNACCAGSDVSFLDEVK